MLPKAYYFLIYVYEQNAPMESYQRFVCVCFFLNGEASSGLNLSVLWEWKQIKKYTLVKEAK